MTPIGAENGAATESELAALSAIMALGGSIATDEATIARTGSLLAETLGDRVGPEAGGRLIGRARRSWSVGSGPGRGVAEALGLLLYEKARIAAVWSSPSGFRHGLVEASAPSDAMVVFECRVEAEPLAGYLDLLELEAARLHMPVVWITSVERRGISGPLRGTTVAERLLEAVLRAQQLTHAAAHAAGTYVDGFTLLRSVVVPGDAFEPPV